MIETRYNTLNMGVGGEPSELAFNYKKTSNNNSNNRGKESNERYLAYQSV